MRKNKGWVLILCGMVLLSAALSLFLYNMREDAIAGQEAENLLHEIEKAVSERLSASGSHDLNGNIGLNGTMLPEIEVNGYRCVGIISIPKLEIELPVISQWDYKRLTVAPCRQTGSTATNDLVIAAHNYDHHFGRLKDLTQGDSVLFTDMNGAVNQYKVVLVDTLSATAVETVLESENDLVLYTCTKGGAKRVSVFCDRIKNQ